MSVNIHAGRTVPVAQTQFARKLLAERVRVCRTKKVFAVGSQTFTAMMYSTVMFDDLNLTSPRGHRAVFRSWYAFQMLAAASQLTLYQRPRQEKTSLGNL